jgi:hypothetical protein
VDYMTDQGMTLAELGELRAALRDKLKTVTEDLRTKSLEELDAKRMSEAEVSRVAKVDRMTIRKWQGKP